MAFISAFLTPGLKWNSVLISRRKTSSYPRKANQFIHRNSRQILCKLADSKCKKLGIYKFPLLIFFPIHLFPPIHKHTDIFSSLCLFLCLSHPDYGFGVWMPAFNLCSLFTPTQLILLCVATSLEFNVESPVVTVEPPPQALMLPKPPLYPGNHRCER